MCLLLSAFTRIFVVVVKIDFFSYVILYAILAKFVVQVHFVESTRPASEESVAPPQTVDSFHPYYPMASYKGKISFQDTGAKALGVSFDPRCSINAANASLSFFLDEELSNPIATFTGDSPSHWPATVIEAGEFWYLFRSRSDQQDPGWGFRFKVSPIRGLQWLNESEVGRDASLEWACWVLDFLLNDGKELGVSGAVHSAQVRVAVALVHLS